MCTHRVFYCWRSFSHHIFYNFPYKQSFRLKYLFAITSSIDFFQECLRLPHFLLDGREHSQTLFGHLWLGIFCRWIYQFNLLIGLCPLCLCQFPLVPNIVVSNRIFSTESATAISTIYSKALIFDLFVAATPFNCLIANLGSNILVVC